MLMVESNICIFNGWLSGSNAVRRVAAPPASMVIMVYGMVAVGGPEGSAWFTHTNFFIHLYHRFQVPSILRKIF